MQETEKTNNNNQNNQQKITFYCWYCNRVIEPDADVVEFYTTHSPESAFIDVIRAHVRDEHTDYQKEKKKALAEAHRRIPYYMYSHPEYYEELDENMDWEGLYSEFEREIEEKTQKIMQNLKKR